MKFTVIQGDIAAQQADALVNAAGTSLKMGSGVAGFAFERGAELICSVIAEHEPSTLTDVRVIAYSDSEYESLQSVADAIRD